ncbi:hypothetical protein JCM6882_003565 [Rhodosporidiobolus microsporus]
MLLRDAAAPNLTLPPAATPPAFPGLVSSLRPLRRIAAQVADESSLLRRFTYKNKNQFKGTGWWRKLVEVDRVTARAGDELKALLKDFGIESEKDEPGAISREAVCKGLLRLPRAMLVVEKNIDVLLGCASILEQLIHSRAFLAFALVVVALIARLHSLFTVLLDDLSRTGGVLVKLAELNGLLPSLEKSLRNLPRDVRRFLPLDASGKPASHPTPTASTAPSAAATPTAASPAPSASDDLGAVISRSSLSAKAAPAPLPPSSLSASVSVSTSRAASPALVATKPKKKRPVPPEPEKPPSRTASPAIPSLFGLDSPKSAPPASASTSGASTPKSAKRPRVEADDLEPTSRAGTPAVRKEKKEGKEKIKVKKKVKKRKGGGDEIDAIFG